jgi:MFS family permease
MTIELSAGRAFPRRESALLALVSAAHFISHVHIMVLPALIPLLPGHVGVSFLDIGFALTVFNLVSLAVQTPMGFATDRLGPGPMLIGALLLGGLSYAALALLPGYPALLAAMAVAGVANGIYHPADYALLSGAIGERRLGRAFSVHTFAGFLGTAVTPALLLAVAHAASVPSAFALAGGAGIAVALLLLVSRPLLRPARAVSSIHAAPTAGLRDVLTGRVLLLTLLFALLNLSTGGIAAFAVTALLRGYGIDLASAGTALTAFLFASAAGVLAGGVLADRARRHGLAAAATMALAALLTLAVTVLQPVGLVLTLLLAGAGFFAGVITPSRDLLVRAAAPAGAEGRVFGIVSTGFNVGGAAGPVIFAALVDHGHFQAVFGLTALFMLLTAALTLLPVFERPAAAR